MRELHTVKVRHALLLVAIAALLGAGCGKDEAKGSASSDSKDTKAKPAKQSAGDKVVEQKQQAVQAAGEAFDKKPKDANLCRDLGLKLIALASPESTGDPKKAPEIPKDREKNLKKATDVLETCHELAPKDAGITSMLASVKMAGGEYKDASTLLGQLAKGTPKDANAFYAWGLAASNATDYATAITAWTKFAQLADPKDPRVSQVRQSISALKAQEKQAKASPPAAAPDATAATKP